MQTHENYIQAVAAIAIARLDPNARSAFEGIKLVYGSGPNGTHGVTYFKRWRKDGTHHEARPFVEVCAFGQESWIQLAGTTIHELAHVLAGWSAGHGTDWKRACGELGLRRCHAAGTCYLLANFDPDLRLAIAAITKPDDGAPVPPMLQGLLRPGTVMKPCGAAIGTRGGTSRGKGSGSRLRLWVCDCQPPVKARVASDHFAAHCDHCDGSFCLAVT